MTADQMDDIMIAISKFFKEQGAEDIVVEFEYGNAIDSICRVTVSRSYSIGTIASFANMNWLSNLLHTQEINLENETHHSGGCDTCDYGSYTEIDFVCLNINPFDE